MVSILAWGSWGATDNMNESHSDTGFIETCPCLEEGSLALKRIEQSGKVPLVKKRILYGELGLKTLARGMRDTARVVGVTYGPDGGKVAISKLGKTVVTTDGAALVRESQFGDLRRLGASLIRSASMSVEEQSGDGTSTTTLLADALLQQALRYYTHKWDPVTLINEIKTAADIVSQRIEAFSQRAGGSHLKRVGLMSSHGDGEVTDKLLEAVLYAGEFGTVTLAKGEGVGIEVEKKEGLVLDEGWVSPHMSKGDHERALDGPLVAVLTKPVASFEEIQPLLEGATQWPGRGLCIFTPGIWGTALSTILLNDQKAVLPCVVVQYKHNPRGLTDWLDNIAAVTNATKIDPQSGHDLKKFDTGWFGYARKVTVSKTKTTIVSYMDGEITEKVDARIRSLLTRAEQSTHDYDKDTYREMAASMDGGLCVVKVGGYTENEAQDRRSRAEDTLRAMQSALQSGVVPGAGWSYFWAGKNLPATDGGVVVSRALETPLRTLVQRSQLEPEVVVSLSKGQLTGPWHGWDPVSKTWRDFREDPMIVDPTGVVLNAFRSAVSVVCQTLLVGAVVHSCM